MHQLAIEIGHVSLLRNQSVLQIEVLLFIVPNLSDFCFFFLFSFSFWEHVQPHCFDTFNLQTSGACDLKFELHSAMFDLRQRLFWRISHSCRVALKLDNTPRCCFRMKQAILFVCLFHDPLLRSMFYKLLHVFYILFWAKFATWAWCSLLCFLMLAVCFCNIRGKQTLHRMVMYYLMNMT